MQAIIYARFSSDAQGAGDSIPRQLRTCTPYIESKGWTLDTVLKDEGRSGFKGHHRLPKATLGTLEREALDGIHAGKVLVIERLDRLSREDHNETYDLIRGFTKSGLSIATVEGDRLYEAYQPIEFAAMIELLVRSKMNHEESAKKASHGRAKWEARRAIMAATKKPMSALCPAWLRISEDRERYEVFESRDKTVRLIFELADSGMGSQRIARALNDRGIKPWPRFANRTPRAWSRGTLVRMLTDPAVMGDHQPMRMEGGARVADGEPIRDYYPRVIEPDLFLRVSAAAGDRKAVAGNKADVPNLVAGLAYCSSCGAKMNYRHNRRAGHVRIRNGIEQAPTKNPSASLICPIAMDGGCSNKRTIAYISLEKALIDAALHLSMDDASFSRREDVARLDIQIADRQRDHDIAYASAVELWSSAGASAIAQKLAGQREAEAETIAAEIADMKAARSKAAGKVTAAEHISRLNAVRESLNSEDDEERTTARLKVAQGFRSIIDRIECREDGQSVVRIVGGKRMMFIKAGRGRAAPEVSDFDLLHPGRDNSSDDPRIQRYVKRATKASLGTN